MKLPTYSPVSSAKTQTKLFHALKIDTCCSIKKEN